ncbi:2-oxo-4-hydroxy-4-carboxy-5-ureidoimidazoline decarboxylase [Agromyces sp. SYSU K20354]|uniref:2-oxo-4-hydroxy-4-carboxy-5-ureidoimidazoline decarboxylase n=1 Tax=Agromyces cavernae TaxID=2898659 RepID=UPI001E50E426|nr:2-oxo-4-hydroxy-4-carboxy-5-ureidoimidazoline decarboxylase [Agromyces cavernae]MCD2442915.1 2-oxo-4-hydroxy-4-carboxy-5-ureidoimidazoline decarboxylase [Agromyces cavernae]
MSPAHALHVFNSAARDEAIASLRPCLDIPRWCESLVDGRPYASAGDLVAAAEVAASPFTTAEVDGALAQHPRIGERAGGSSAEARMSRAEQAGVGTPKTAVAAALAEGNLAYERRFGRVFLIRVAGRSATEILGALNERLGHTDDEELPVVAEQLRQIAVLRLKGLFE